MPWKPLADYFRLPSGALQVLVYFAGDGVWCFRGYIWAHI